ncbi:MAG: sigma-70 family RNA polymerase sigma factor [Actinobacteria bacterium]|nr:sigma-70 family RNA polymerase sigma factor [Actinomycetota bacterium]
MPAPPHEPPAEDPQVGPTDPSADVTLTVAPGSKTPMQHRSLGRADLEEVVDAARQGDRDAFDELVRRTHADTYSLARRLVSDPDDARDVVQEAYLRAFRSIRKFRGDAQFTTWMHRITANCASTQLGRRRRHRHDELDEEVAVTDTHPDRDPEAQADAALLRQRLEAAIADLPPRLRAVVVLRDVYDLGHAEIAEELGITESAAKVRLHRARRKLRGVVFPMRDEVMAVDEGEEQARAV